MTCEPFGGIEICKRAWASLDLSKNHLPRPGAGHSSACRHSPEPFGRVIIEGDVETLPQSDSRRGTYDDRPIHTAAFLSNWELSAARAASVVHQFTKQGIDPLRLEIVGFGEFHPRQPNASAEGRNANRRVAVLVLEAVSPMECHDREDHRGDAGDGCTGC